MVSGRIVELGEKELVLKRDDGEEPNVILVLAPEAAVTVAGKEARPSDLKEGMHVRAAFESVNDKEIAVRVDARP
jgi:hypothetical protein